MNAGFRQLMGWTLACLIFLMSLPVPALAADDAESKYYNADACYKRLESSTSKKKYRHNWETCIEKYKAVYDHDPSGPWAAAGLYMCGKLYYGLSLQSGLEADMKKARSYFQRIIRNYPQSRYKSRSEKELATIAKKLGTEETAVSSNAGSDSITTLIRRNTATAATSAKTSGSPTTVEAIRYWSNPNYTRVVIDADKETTFAHRRLKEDPSISKPQRLFVDLTNSRIGSGLQKEVAINDNLLISARAGQNTPDQVRVVVDIKSFESYKVFSLKNPFRIVIDIWGENGTGASGGTVADNTPTSIDALGKSALATQLALGVRRIVVDPGHGGKDYGAPGYQKGVHEKDVVLAISKKLAAKLEKELGCEVVMTRTTDKYLTLEERTAIANTKSADLFISVHTNSHTDRRAYGIETYFLNLATDNDAILVAARENATSAKNISDLDSILNDLLHNVKVNESSRLAAHVQSSLCSGLSKNYSKIKNKKVKQAPFYVLLGAQMPAILVETSFISNKTECERLVDSKYQDAMVQSITEGVQKYIRETTNPTALYSKNPNQG
jgi:N-acetylmuramoyl-L-alanine amidase